MQLAHLLVLPPMEEDPVSTSQSYVIREGQSMILGRSYEADIVIRHPTVSRRHAVLALLPTGLQVTDLGSSNGITLAGEPLQQGSSAMVESGELLEIGDVGVRVSLVHPGGRKRGHTPPPLPTDQFTFVERLGSGSHGAVWAAWQNLLERMVAVKVLHEDFRLDQESEEARRFLREAQICAKVRSPYIVELYDVRIADSIPYLIMELVQGPTALERVQDADLEVAEALGIGADVSQALLVLAEHEIVHRDIKPANVLLAPECAKLTDFGIAKLDQPLAGDLTQSGIGLGSLPYAAPEQVREARVATIQSDLYSLGATLYHLIAGRPAFPARVDSQQELMAVVAKIENEPPTRLRSLNSKCPSALEIVVDRLMSKKPADRGTTREAVRDLLALRSRMRMEGTPAEETQSQARTTEGRGRRRPGGRRGE
jgi:serine/threonine protein kinase